MLCALCLLAWEYPFVESCSLVHHRLFMSLFSASSIAFSVFCCRFLFVWLLVFVFCFTILFSNCFLLCNFWFSVCVLQALTAELAARREQLAPRKKLLGSESRNKIENTEENQRKYCKFQLWGVFFLWFVSHLQRRIEHWVCGSKPGRNRTVENSLPEIVAGF